MVKRKAIIEELLFLYYEGVTSKEETRLIEEWLELSVENKRIAKEIQLIDLASDLAEVSSQLNVEKALMNTRYKMKHTTKHTFTFKRMQRTAAILFIPLLLPWFLLFFYNKPQEANRIEIKTNPGMTASVTLPDSTVVILNSSSSLQYPSLFASGTREVTLQGEAFFSVKKDEKKKFVVKTWNGSQIMVYGTEFNIEAYQEDESVQTTLVSGKVGFSYVNKGEKEFVMMKPGQKLIYDIAQEKVVLKKANVEAETSWKDGRLVFKNTPFEDILKSLSKRYNVKFILKNESLKQNSFTGMFVKQRLERILERFHISSDIHFKFIENEDINKEQQIIEVY